MDMDVIRNNLKLIKRGINELVSEDELVYKLVQAEKRNKPLIIKEGVDPTAPDIHLGHTVTLRKLRHFQDIGQHVKFLIGDFTARIGDPSGRESGRKVMTEEDVLRNAETYKQQIFKILDPDKTEVVYNSSWLRPFTLAEIIPLLYRGTVNDMTKRKSIAARLEKGDTVTVTEFLYPFLQAYDSVALEADVEVGGEDQTFNFSFTRDIQRSYGQEPEVYVTMPLLTGIDGKEKMSKSLGNHIGINDSANDMYGKVMSLPDNVMYNWFELLTDIPLEELIILEGARLRDELNPKDMKMRLAKEITSQYHSLDEALEAEKEFEKVHKYREIPETIPEVVIKSDFIYREGVSIVDIVKSAGYCSSASDARRKIEQGGVRIDDDRITDVNKYVTPKDGQVLRVGKKDFAKLKYES